MATNSPNASRSASATLSASAGERAGVRCRSQVPDSALRTPHSALPPLLSHFATLAETPDAVAKLRGFVRDLAVRGSLVPQNNKDEPTTELLKRIIDEKRRLNREGGGKATTDFEPLTADACPFVIPTNWTWVRTQDVTTYVQRGKSPKYTTEQKIPVIAQKCIQWHGFELHKAQFIDPESLGSYSEDRFVRDGDLLWNSTGLGTLGRIIVFKDRFKEAYPQVVADSHVTVIRPSKLVDPDYLFCWFAGPTVQSEINAKASGSTKQTELATSTVLSYAIPLPPLAEQRRIVAKVEELLALCDELEARQTADREQRNNLVRSALDHLTAATDEAEFRKYTSLVTSHSSLILDDVPALRQAILSLAAQGKVVNQEPNDETAESILKKIEHERRGSAVAVEPLASVEKRETPFPLPSSWRWVRLGEIASIKHGFAFSSESFTSKPTAFVLTTPGNFHEQGGFRDRGSKTKYFDGAVDPEFILKPRDLIIPMTEQAAGLLGSPAFIPDDGKCYLHNQRLGKLGFYSKSILPEFVFWFFNCAFFRNELARTCTGMKVRHTSPKRILSVPFPLCSLAEQQRIVAKVAELMRWCDALEDRLTAAQTSATHLLDATLHHILAA